MKESIPEQSETIKARRSLRLAEKIRNAREGIATHKAWWSNGTVEVLGLLFVFLVNLYLIYPYFGTHVPSKVFSGPVIPLLAKGISLLGTPFLYSVEIVYIVLFLFFPISLYFFVKKLSNRKWVGFLAALIASLPFAYFAKTRIAFSMSGTDGSHIASLTVLPFAVTWLISFLRQGGTKNLLVAAFSAAIIALVSPFGFLAYIIFALISTFSEFLLGEGRLKLLRLFMVLVIAGGLNSFWYDPRFFLWMVTGPMGTDLRATLSKLIPISFFAGPILAIFGYLLFDRKPNLQPFFLAFFYTVTFMVLVFAGGGFFSFSPSRFLPEFGISLPFLGSIVIFNLVSNIKFAKIFRNSLSEALAPNLVFLAAFVFLSLAAILTRYNILPEESLVLGVWTEIEKSDIWIARDGISGNFVIFGYLITFATLVLIAILPVISKEKYAKNK